MEKFLWPIDLEGKPSCHYIGSALSEEHNNKTYCLPNLWCIHLYDFEGTLTMTEGCLDVRPGDVGIIPPGKTVAYAVYGTGVHIACHFRLEGKGSAQHNLPALMATGTYYPSISETLQEMLHLYASNPLATDIKLWNLLLDLERLSQRRRDRENALHPALETCVQHIELNLGMRLSVADLVQRAGISHPSLVKLFKTQFDCTVTEYIQKRRMIKARHLLTETDQPVKAVAIDCGFTDLQYFNKCVRKAYGMPPRAFR